MYIVIKGMISDILKNPFIRNVSTLALGSVISQAIVVLSSPLLTRIYAVESFGTLSVFTSITVFFAVIATGRYELAIGLPKKDAEAAKLFKLILNIGFYVSVLYLVTIFILKELLELTDRSGFLDLKASYYAPGYIYLIAINSALNYWAQRKKKYKGIALSAIIQAFLTSAMSFLFGFLEVQQGLIIALFSGVLGSVIYLCILNKEILGFLGSNIELKSISRQYSKFPKFAIISDLALTANHQFMPILFSALFNTTVVGFFSMANRMLRLPNIVITSSIANVFRNQAIDELHEKGNCKDLFVYTFRKLTSIAIPLYITIFFISPWAFRIFFGSQWIESGKYAQILSLVLLTDFITTPLNALFYITEKQRLYLKLQMLNTIGGIVFAFCGAYFFQSPYWSLALFGANGVAFNLVLLLCSYHISRNK